jgi:DNA-binding NtrC family response regulator
MPETPPETDPPGISSQSDADASPSPRVKVLVVDDRSDLTDAISSVLADEGCDVVVANTAENLSALLRALRPTALILDVMMPGRDGYDALPDIATFDTKLPVLLISGHGSTWLRMGETLGRANGLSHVETATKPIRRARLITFVHDVEALQAG